MFRNPKRRPLKLNSGEFWTLNEESVKFRPFGVGPFGD